MADVFDGLFSAFYRMLWVLGGLCARVDAESILRKRLAQSGVSSSLLCGVPFF